MHYLALAAFRTIEGVPAKVAQTLETLGNNVGRNSSAKALIAAGLLNDTIEGLEITKDGIAFLCNNKPIECKKKRLFAKDFFDKYGNFERSIKQAFAE